MAASRRRTDAQFGQVVREEAEDLLELIVLVRRVRCEDAQDVGEAARHERAHVLILVRHERRVHQLLGDGGEPVRPIVLRNGRALHASALASPRDEICPLARLSRGARKLCAHAAAQTRVRHGVSRGVMSLCRRARAPMARSRSLTWLMSDSTVDSFFSRAFSSLVAIEDSSSFTFESLSAGMARASSSLAHRHDEHRERFDFVQTVWSTRRLHTLRQARSGRELVPAASCREVLVASRTPRRPRAAVWEGCVGGALAGRRKQGPGGDLGQSGVRRACALRRGSSRALECGEQKNMPRGELHGHRSMPRFGARFTCSAHRA